MAKAKLTSLTTNNKKVGCVVKFTDGKIKLWTCTYEEVAGLFRRDYTVYYKESNITGRTNCWSERVACASGTT